MLIENSCPSVTIIIALTILSKKRGIAHDLPLQRQITRDPPERIYC